MILTENNNLAVLTVNGTVLAVSRTVRAVSYTVLKHDIISKNLIRIRFREKLFLDSTLANLRQPIGQMH